MFREDADVDDIVLEDLDASKMHPAAKTYFFLRQSENEVLKL
jgi:hypothetical protein